MASTSSKKQLKHTSLFMVAALLLLICICTCTTRGQAATPEPGLSKDHMPQRAVSAAGGVAGNDHEKSGSSAAGVEMLQEEPEEMRECEDGDEREECLMRRTLVAHTDYIYTQGKHN